MQLYLGKRVLFTFNLLFDQIYDSSFLQISKRTLVFECKKINLTKENFIYVISDLKLDPRVCKDKIYLIILSLYECFSRRTMFISVFRPHDTPFEDGTFKLTIEFTEEYPNKPPTVRFVSKMFHPNVYADGGICLDILQNRWSPTYDVSAILTSIQVCHAYVFSPFL